MNQLALYFSFLMIAVYMVVGFLLIFSNLLMNIISQYRFGLGIVFIVYASFRTILTIQKLRRKA